MDEFSIKILEILEKKGGFLLLSDKLIFEVIFVIFCISKGMFKKIIGGLYK